MSQCALCSPQCDAVSAFEPVELATAGFFCVLRRFQSTHARVDKPLFTIGLNDLWLYPAWFVRFVENVARGVVAVALQPLLGATGDSSVPDRGQRLGTVLKRHDSPSHQSYYPSLIPQHPKDEIILTGWLSPTQP